MDRARVKRLLAQGRLRPDQISLASSLPELGKSRLVLPKLGALECSEEWK